MRTREENDDKKERRNYGGRRVGKKRGMEKKVLKGKRNMFDKKSVNKLNELAEEIILNTDEQLDQIITDQNVSEYSSRSNK